MGTEIKEPTLSDLMNQLHKNHAETNKHIDDTIGGIKSEINNIRTETKATTQKMTELEKNIEILKQDKLKNNVKISGLPDIKFESEVFVYNLFNTLDIELVDEDFDSYFTKYGNFIIIQFDSYKKKAMLLRKMKEKKGVMTEQIFEGIKSNSQIYVNDQLTPYFGKLLQSARSAMKNGKLLAVSSRGGKIRIKKNEQSPFIFIFNEYELNHTMNSASSEPNLSRISASTSVSQPNSSIKSNEQAKNTYKKRNKSNNTTEGDSEETPRIRKIRKTKK